MDSYNSTAHFTHTCNIPSSCCNEFNVDIAASLLRCHSSFFCVVTLRFAFLSTNSLWIILLSTPFAATHSRSFAQFLEPTMLYYDGTDSGVTLTIGKDAGYYHKNCPNVLWNGERQPFGYAGVRRLFEALAEV